MNRALKIAVLLLAVLINVKVAHAQNSRWDSTATTTAGRDQAVPLLALPGAAVTFYNMPAMTLANTYTSATSGTPCPTNAQVVLSLGNTCVATADFQGNFGGWFLAGQYAYTFLFNGQLYGPFPFTVGTGGGGGTLTAPVVIEGDNTTVNGDGQVLQVTGNFTGPTQQFPLAFNLSQFTSQHGWSYGAPYPGLLDPVWAGSKAAIFDATFLSQGINDGFSLNAASYTIGDFQGLGISAFANGGTTAGSDEGNVALKVNSGQNPQAYSGAVEAGATTGSTALPVSPTGFIGTGAPLLLTSREVISTNVTGISIGIPIAPTLTLSSAGTASGGSAIYTGTITGGGSNAYAGYFFIVSGFTTAANNGTLMVSASTTTTLTLNTNSAVAETHAATASRWSGLVGYPTASAPTRSAAYGMMACVSALSPTGTATAGSATITGVSSIAGVYFGQAISGTGIPDGALVAGASGNTITLNQGASGSGTGVLTITGDGLPETHPIPNTLTSTAVYTSMTCTAQAVSGTNGSGFVPGIARIASGFMEQVNITSVGTLSGGNQTIVLSYRNPHANLLDGKPMLLFQGGTAGYVGQTWREAIEGLYGSGSIFGSTDGVNVVCAVQFFRTVTNCNNTYDGEPPTTLTGISRTGTTVTATTTNGGGYLNSRTSAVVSGCSDSSINGTGTNFAINGNVLTWTSANSGTTSCASATVTANIYGIAIRKGAEVVDAQTAGTGGADIAHLEVNDVDWTTGDFIAGSYQTAQTMAALNFTYRPITSAGTGSTGPININVFGPGMANGAPMITTFNNSNPTWFQGMGGNLPPPGPFAVTQGLIGGGLWFQSAPPAGGIIFRIGYPASAKNVFGDPTNTTPYNVFFFDQGLSMTADPITHTWSMDNIRTNTFTANSLFIPNISLGSTGNIPGEVYFNRGEGTAAKFSLCGKFGTSDYLGITSGGADDCNLLNRTNQPDGVLGSGVLDAQLNARMNNLVVGLPYAQGLPNVVATCTGTCATSWQYRTVSVNAAGEEGAFDPYGVVINAVLNASTLDGSHFNTLTCPTALQQGYPGGTTYAVYSGNNTTGVFYHIGTCALGTTVVDDGSFSVITNPPAYGANADFAAGRVIVNNKGSIGFQFSQIISNMDVQLSNPSSGLMSVDSTTIGDHQGSLTLKDITMSGVFHGPGSYNSIQPGVNVFSALPTCVSGLDGSIAPVTDSSTSTGGATISGGGSNHVAAYCNGTNWVVL